MTDVQLTQWMRHSVIVTLSMTICHSANCVLVEIQNKGHLLHGQIMVMSEISCDLGAYTKAATAKVCN